MTYKNCLHFFSYSCSVPPNCHRWIRGIWRVSRFQLHHILVSHTAGPRRQRADGDPSCHRFHHPHQSRLPGVGGAIRYL